MTGNKLVLYLSKIRQKIDGNAKKYYSIRYFHEEWRKRFQHSLLEALAKTEHVQKKSLKKRLNREEKQRVLGRKAIRIWGKGTKLRDFRAFTTNDNRETIKFKKQLSMVSCIAQSNRVQQQQYSRTAFMILPLV